MRLTQEDVNAFSQLYTIEFGEALSEDQAREMAQRVAHLYSLLARPLPSELEDMEKQKVRRLASESAEKLPPVPPSPP